MIRLLLSGGLGNQLFEYATARAVSLRTGTELEIDLRFYSKDSIGTPKAPWLMDLPVKARFKSYDESWLDAHNPLRRGIEKAIFERFREVFIDNKLGFNEGVMRLGPNAVLNGYFQCYRYVEHNWSSIAPDLDMSRFADVPFLDGQQKVAQAWCAVHVRRGDYVGDVRFEMERPERYYTAAMMLVARKKPCIRFVVFSDDVVWCRVQPWLAHCEFYEGPSNRHPAVDLATMSRADGNIIANSSYSWWSAWIGQKPGKVVVAPSIWIDGHRTRDLQMVPNCWDVV